MPLSFRAVLLATILVGLADSSAWSDEYQLHHFEKRQLSNEFFGEGAAFGDFNRDGHVDIVSGPFWYAGPDFASRREIYSPKPFNPKGYSNNFFAFVHDFNGDQWDDVLVLGFPGKDASWFENPGKASADGDATAGHWHRHVVMDVVDNESPTWVDLTGDGKPEVVCSQGGYFGYASPNWDKPQAKWTFHRISDKSAGGRFTHGLGVGDVNGDGRMDLLEKRGWWEQPASLDAGQWTFHAHRFSPGGGAQMYAYDVDGDGDNDVITSLAAHAWGLAWYEQKKDEQGRITFGQHDMMPHKPQPNKFGVMFSQLHALDLVDINGDGLKDIVTGKRWYAHNGHDPGGDQPAVLYWFELVRKKKGDAESVEWVPHLIDDDSGVGTQVMTGDINGDKLVDIVVGNKKGTFVHLHGVKEVSKEAWQRAQPKPVQQRDKAAGLSPEEAAQAMSVPPGFDVQLVAGEPRIHQPIAFAIDARGRLWIAEAHTYPVRAPEGQGKDKIVILEDADGDGSFETRKTFVDGLNLVSGLEVGFGGVWVGAPPYLLFIPDADGDDRPDGPSQVLLDGWGHQDTHETLNSFIWGPDGWLYGCHGVFTHSRVGKPGTPDQDRTLLNAGVWRYHPTRHEFEVFAHGTSNPWGVDFNDRGQAFATACVIPHLYHVIHGARYQRQAGKHFNEHVYDDIKTIADHAHYAGNIRDHAWWGRNEPVAHDTTDAASGGHAHCGAMIYLGDNWPDRYRNTIFMNNVHGNRVNNDILERRGSGFVGRHGKDFLLANDHWFRGINLKYGPDGGVFLIDWYDKNACHRRNPEIWDRSNGRVFKITYGSPDPVKVDLDKLTNGELIDLQSHRNDWYCRTARRILQSRTRNPQASENLRQRLGETKDVSVMLRLLWTLHVTEGVSESDAAILLRNEHEDVRGWTVQLVCEDREVGPTTLGILSEMAHHDESPLVRLYLASALQRLPHEHRWPIAHGLVSHADDERDHNLPLMIWYGVEPLMADDPGRAAKLLADTKLSSLRRFMARRLATVR